MSRIASFLLLCAVASLAGCCHRRIVAAADARDYGDMIRTAYRYRLVCAGKEEWQWRADSLQLHQPHVFDDTGVPVIYDVTETLNDDGENATEFLLVATCGIFPGMWTSHLHRRCVLSCGGKKIASFDVCARKATATALHPLPVLLFSWGGTTCFASGREFSAHRYNHEIFPPYCGIDTQALAYGIASRLKEAEEAGVIDDQFVAAARSAQALSDTAEIQSKLKRENAMRHGARVGFGASSGTQPFEIVRCETDQGKDFAYGFALRRRDGGAATLSDYGVMRSAFRSAIRSQYTSSHPEVNPRTLVVDFTTFALKDGLVVGRVAVLSISPESLTYDSARRKGVIRVRIGEGQFEDARRWIRRNLSNLASRSNIVIVGDAVPQGAHFYSEREELRNGFLEMSFKTE